MTLEEALRALKAILQEALISDHRWRFLVSKIPELTEILGILAKFAGEMFAKPDLVMATDVYDLQGELMSLLCDVLDEDPKPQLGPLAWMMIVKLIVSLLEAIQDHRTELQG